MQELTYFPTLHLATSSREKRGTDDASRRVVFQRVVGGIHNTSDH